MKLHKSLHPFHQCILTKGLFTVGSLKLFQNYFIDFINLFPDHNLPQTFIPHTPDVTTVHNDIGKIKTMFFGVKLLHYLR